MRPSPVIFEASSTTYQKSSDEVETILDEQKYRQLIAREAHEKDIVSIQTASIMQPYQPPFFFTELSNKKLV